MERVKWPILSGAVIGTVWLSITVPTTFAFDKPLLTFDVLLLSAALAVLTLGYILHRRGVSGTFQGGLHYEQLPLNEIEHQTDANTGQTADTTSGSVWTEKGALVLHRLQLRHVLIGAIVLRVEILRQILANTQCTVLTWEPLIPVVFAGWEYSSRRHSHPPNSVYTSDTVGQRPTRTSLLSLVVTSVVCFGGLLALATTRDPRSTFICAATLHNRWLIPLMQRFGMVLDVSIAACVARYLNEDPHDPRDSRGTQKGDSPLISVGSTILRTAQLTTLWSALLFVVYLIAAAKPQERWRMLEVPGYYLWSLVTLDISACSTLLCALLSIPHLGLPNLSLLLVFASICTITTSTAIDHIHASPHATTASFIAICITTLGFAAYSHIATVELETSDGNLTSTPANRSWLRRLISGWPHLGLLIFIVARGAVSTMQSGNVISHHPIDTLIHNAQLEHDTYRRQALTSGSLGAAVETYHTRYHKHPPPAFDHWYSYATERQSAIIDDYDSIDQDLSPFYAMTPKDIRHYTKQMLQDPWYNVTGICVRDGKTSICSHVNDDHRWMIERLSELIGMFSQWLPDMDLAFNVNDECRVSVPWYDLRALQNAAEPPEIASSPANKFSADRAAQWERAGQIESEKMMTDISWQPIFRSHGTAHCPPASRARKQRWWDRSRLCAACAAKHSIGPFLANWTTDVCYEPDLAELHGFYTSPSAFKASYQLLPIFSQSKAPGFNDILYPSAWNWDDKAKYAPNAEHPDGPFVDKNDSIFWRGTTSEGMSPDTGQWKGQSRQRFVHVLNDINVGGATQHLPVPRARGKEGLTYTNVPITTLTSLIDTDVHFVSLQRCWDIDCPQQAAEFGLATRTDFQAHWQYKYLLDLDGAGFSGRFLPFMFSRSLPFKAALFKEWWNDRLTAWCHFVPLDLRAHGVWPTLAYFTGLHGQLNRQDVQIPPQHSKGEKIAADGRAWAEKVLRKDDMEIYFFRLLLEWGRLTDDDRDGIGFTLAEG